MTTLRTLAAALAALALTSNLAAAKPRSAAHAAKDRAILACIDERTGPDGGLDLDEASKLCRTIARHEAKVARLAKLASHARAAGIARLADRAMAECREEVVSACLELSDDQGSCSDATLTAKHAFDTCRGKEGK